MREPKATPPSQLPSLTGLRWIAAFGVFLVHLQWAFGRTPLGPAFENLRHIGFTGVGLFFVLSGYLLVQPGAMRGGTRGFWRRRFARVAPMYWFSLAVMLAMLWGQHLRGHGHLPTAVNTLMNVVLLQAWGSGTEASLVLPAWSLSVEILFYALLPLVFNRVIRFMDQRPLIALLGLVLYGAGASGVFAAGMGSAATPPFFLAVFFLGSWAARTGDRYFVSGSWTLLTLFLSGAVVLALGDEPSFEGPPALNLVAGPYAMTVSWLAQRDRAGTGTWLASPLMRRLGVWSYSFFLLQVPVMFAAYVGLEHQPTNVVVGLLDATGFLAVALGASALCYRLLEEPARARIGPPARPTRSNSEKAA